MRRAEATILHEYLVASAKAGDAQAFQLLAKRWQKKLIAHAWRLTGDPEGARDAAQEGWIEIVRGIGRLEDERAFPAWAYRIVSRRCARQIGSAVRRRQLAEAALADPAVEEAERWGLRWIMSGCAPPFGACRTITARRWPCFISRN